MSAKADRKGRVPLPAPREVLHLLSGYLLGQWDELLRLRLAVLHRFENEDIHDLRVASRRLRVVVDQLEPFTGREAMVRLRRPVRKLTRELGLLRNLDEARSYLAGLHDDGLHPLTAQLEQQRNKEARRVRQLLQELSCHRMERQFRAAAEAVMAPEQIATQGIFGMLSERNLALYRPIHDLLQLANLPDQAEERHALRIAIKKWRYFNELLEVLLGRSQPELLARLKVYQTLLGELNDREVFQGMVRGAAELSPATRERVEAVITAQHRRMVQRFKTLLAGHPLQYQFVA